MSTLAVLSAVLLAHAVVAWALWSASGSGSSTFLALTMPSGDTPSVSTLGRSVTVSWPPKTLAGNPVDGYTVRRYDGGGVLQTIGSGCSGLITGLSCTENPVDPGTWKYKVAANFQSWSGAEGPESTSVTVGPPALTFTSGTTPSSLPSTLDLSLANFIDGETITFRLDDPGSGTLLSGSISPSPIPASGDSSGSVTIPFGTTNGNHAVYAVGSLGSVASGTVTVSVTPPSPTDLAVNNGTKGVPGKPEKGDLVRVTYSQRLFVASLCSTWSNNTANQSISANNVVTVTIRDNASVLGNDQLEVSVTSAACGGVFHFGQVDLGTSTFVTGDVSFAGAGGNASRIDWDASLFTLTFTLGAQQSGPVPATLGAALTATYQPDATITNTSGTPITGTASKFAILF